MQRILRVHCELHTNKLDNLKEKDKFLETYNLPKTNQNDTDDLNNTITSNKIEHVVLKKKNLLP